VVFSVLASRRIEGRSSTILEGESGANDPVGIALVASLLAAGGLSSSAIGHVAFTFVLQMGVGLAVGVAGGAGLLLFMRRVRLPSEGLFPLRTLACALLLYGAATLAHGSGFLAVFAAGIVIGDSAAPYKLEVERFHSALASLAEIVVFVVLGLTVDLGVLSRADVLVPGLVLGAVGAAVIRPLLVGVCLLPARLARNERRFVLFAGLKGAVPILLGEMVRASHPPEADRLYGIVVIVVVLSVALQGSLVPKAAELLRLPMSIVKPHPWALGVRLRQEPAGAHRVTVAAGSAADGSSLARASELAGDVWISMVVRDSELVALRRESRLAAGDEVVILTPPDQPPALDAFTQPMHGG
jgi:cell volume regulation protein A